MPNFTFSDFFFPLIFYNAGPSQASRHSLTCHDCLCGKEICLSFPKPASSRYRSILIQFLIISKKKRKAYQKRRREGKRR